MPATRDHARQGPAPPRTGPPGRRSDAGTVQFTARDIVGLVLAAARLLLRRPRTGPPPSVQTHVSHILAKLGVRFRAEIIREAVRHPSGRRFATT